MVKDKGYARLDKKRLLPTDLGIQLTEFLVARFPIVFDVGYTASLEADLDRIVTRETTQTAVLSDFWNNQFAPPFRALAAQIAARLHPGETDSQKPKAVGTCPTCGGDLVQRTGPHGTFAGCINFPKCKGTAAPVRLTAKREA
jgi:DNA topoisomerase-1